MSLLPLRKTPERYGISFDFGDISSLFGALSFNLWCIIVQSLISGLCIYRGSFRPISSNSRSLFSHNGFASVPKHAPGMVSYTC